MTKYCTYCGKEIADGVSFCTECGSPAEVPVSKENTPPQVLTETAAAVATIEETVPAAGTTGTQGNSMGGSAAAYQPPQTAYQPPQTAYRPPQTAYQPPQTYYSQQSAQKDKPQKGKYGVVSTGAYVGIMILFMIPIIGLLACIIMAIAPQNENIKHFARAFLIYLLLSVVIMIVLCIVVAIFAAGPLMDYINEVISDFTDGQFGNFGSIEELMEQFGNGKM